MAKQPASPAVRGEKDEWKQFLEDAEAIRKEAPKQISPEKVAMMLTGGECDIPIMQKMVRVFTSSTFTDTEIERNSLMKDVYPYLRRVCSILGLQFNVVDMRWGIRDERSNDHGTSLLCMEEVKKCLNLSLSCAFVSFLGDKYGYRPFPARVDVTELDKIKESIKKTNSADLTLVEHWYQLDTNNIPHQYVLRPIDIATKDKWWGEIFPKLQNMLRQAAHECLNQESAHKYVRSVTEEEVYNGILNNPRAKDQAIFYDREYDHLDMHDKLAKDYKDASKVVGEEDSEAVGLQDTLKKRVHAILPPTGVFRYTVDWRSRPRNISDPQLSAFKDDVCRKITQMTLNRFQQQNIDYGNLIPEIMHHAHTMKAKSALYVVRDELKYKMETFLESKLSTTPLVVYGESGSGKTCFMAKSAYDAKQRYPNAVVVTRFIGTSPQSSDGRSILLSIASQIAQVYGNTKSVSTEFKSLAQLLFLAAATEDQPLIVFLDSLDQMANDDDARDMEWMPVEDKLPPHVHLIVSTLPNEHGILHELQMRYAAHAENFMEVPQLDAKVSREIIEIHLKNMDRTLTQAQMKKVEELAEKCPNPLYIKMVVDLCAKVASYGEIPDLPTTIKGIINEVLLKLERDHGKIVVSHALSYITCAKNGLTENELDDILACDDEVIADLYQWWTPPERRMPPLLWARIVSDLYGYLIIRGSRGHSVYAWYHRQWIQAVQERYLETMETLGTVDSVKKSSVPHLTAREAHMAMADYFSGKWSKGIKKPYKVIDPKTKKEENREEDRLVAAQELYEAEGIPNLRKLSELPYHQIHSYDYSGIAKNSLGYLPFIIAKLEAGLIYEMIEEYLQIEAATNNCEDEEIKQIRLYSRFVRGNARFLKKDPKAAFQLALNEPSDSAIHKEAKVNLPDEYFCMDWTNKSPYANPIELTIAWKEIYYEGQVNQQGAKLAAISRKHTEIISLRSGVLISKIAYPEHSTVRLSFVDGSEIYVFSSPMLYIYSTDTGALLAKTMVLDEPSLPANKKLTYKSTAWKMYASAKNIMITLGDTAYMIDLPATLLWQPTVQYRAHTFKFPIKCPQGNQASIGGFVMVDAEQNEGVNKNKGICQTVWYWGVEDKNPLVMRASSESASMLATISQLGQYLNTYQHGIFHMFDIKNKHKPVAIWTMETYHMVQAWCFSQDEKTFAYHASMNLATHASINLQLITVDVAANEKFEHNSTEDTKVIAKIIHKCKCVDLTELSAGRFVHGNDKYCWVTDTKIPPLKKFMDHPSYSLDGKTMLHHVKSKRFYAGTYVATDLTGSTPQRIYKVSDEFVHVPSPRFDLYIKYSTEKFELRSIARPDTSIFLFSDLVFMCFSPDGQMIACCSTSHRLIIMPVGKSMKSVNALSFDVPIGITDTNNCKFSNSNQYLVINACEHNFQVINFATNKVTLFKTRHCIERLSSIARTKKELNQRYLTQSKVVAFSFDEKYLGIAEKNQVIIYNLDENEMAMGLNLQEGEPLIECVAFSPDSEAILFGLGTEVRWCSVKNGSLLFRFDLGSVSTIISTTLFSTCLGDEAGIVYHLSPMDNRKFGTVAYGAPSLQPTVYTGEGLVANISNISCGTSSQVKPVEYASVAFVHRVRTWFADAQRLYKGHNEIEKHYCELLATKFPQVIEISSLQKDIGTSRVLSVPKQGPAFLVWHSQVEKATPNMTPLPFATMKKTQKAGMPIRLLDFGRELIKVFTNNPTSVDFTLAAHLISPPAPEDLPQIKKFGDELRAIYVQHKAAILESCHRLIQDKKQQIKIEDAKEAHSLENELKKLDMEWMIEKSAKNDFESLKTLGFALQEILLDIADHSDPIDEVLTVAKEFEAQCAGYFLPGELDDRPPCPLSPMPSPFPMPLPHADPSPSPMPLPHADPSPSPMPHASLELEKVEFLPKRYRVCNCLQS